MVKADTARLREYLETLPADGQRLEHDPSGRAIYQLAPAFRTVVLCVPCSYVGLILSIPSRPLVWRCSRCGSKVALNPPAAVLLAPRPVDGTRIGRLS